MATGMEWTSVGASIRRKGSYRSELRIVLIGGRRDGEPSGKSSVGNIILGKDVFETNRRTSKSVMRQDEVSGRQISVVDTPGWRSHYPLDLTVKLTQLEIQKSVHLCPPGPNVFLLVMPLDFAHAGTAKSVEDHLISLLGGQVWRHTIIVFTVADKNKMRPARDFIRSSKDVRYLTRKCEERFHILNITDRTYGSLAVLLRRIEELVNSNGCFYETQKHILEDLEELERTIRSRAEQRRAESQKQTTTLPKHIGLGDLKLVLFGRHLSGKSSAGNTILGKSVFKDHRSGYSEVRHGEVAGIHLTVVDSQGWNFNSQLKDTSEIDKLEIQNSVSLCPPGPHAVLLMVPLDEAFTNVQRVAMEEHMTLLTPGVWSHAIVVFTSGDWLGNTSIEQHIEAEGEDLCWLVDKCGNRYHVLNNKKRDDVQVTELLEKIEEMVAGNRGGHYEVDVDISEKLSERKSNIEKHAKAFMTRTQRQRAALKALFKGEHKSLTDVRVLVGGKQSKRKRAGNYILQKTAFSALWKELETQDILMECVRKEGHVAGRNVSVVDCPDWPNTPPSQKMKDVLRHGVSLCSPGPHAVLLAVSVRSSFSEATRRSMEEHTELLGDGIWRHALVLFTWGRWLGGRPVEEYIKSEGEHLRWLLEKCAYRYHVLQFRKWDILEVTELMEKIEDMVTRNRGHFGHLDSREDRSVRNTGHLKAGDETRQVTLFARLKGKKTVTAEEWNSLEEEWKKREEEWRREEWKERDEEWRRREEELIDRMLKFVVTDLEEPTLPDVRRTNSMDRYSESMSGGTPSVSESLDHWPIAKVDYWLQRQQRSVAASSGYDTMSQATTQTDTDVMSVSSVIMSSSEVEEKEKEGEEDDVSEGLTRVMLIESSDEELTELDLEDSDDDELCLRTSTNMETAQPCCENCKHIQRSYGSEMIIPTKSSRGRLQAHLKGEGTYECVSTGLIFEASEQVLVCYSVLPWSKFCKFLQNPWMIAGPIFNIQTVDKDPSALKYIQLPHSLCLAGQEKERVFGVLHVTGKDPVIERVQYSGSHLKWPVSTLSPVGSTFIPQETQLEKCHGAVLVYQDLRSSEDSYAFRFYLCPSNSSWHKDIKKELKKGHFSRVKKNTLCPLLVEKTYHLMSEPSGVIHPEDLLFTLAPTMYKGFFEAFYEQPPPFTFYLNLSGSEDTRHTWSANIQQGNLVKITGKSPNKILQLLGLGSGKRSTLRKQRCDASAEGITSRPTRRSPLHQLGASSVKEPQISQKADMKAEFVEKNRRALIQRVREVLSIADDLLEKRIFTKWTYDNIREAKTTEDQMRILFDAVHPKGKRAMSAFYDALQEYESFLVEALEEDQGR